MADIRAFTIAAFMAILPPFALADTGPPIAGAKTSAEAAAIQSLRETLEAWLTAYSDYPEAERPLKKIRLVEPGYRLNEDGRSMVLGSTLRGAYLIDTATIYLVRPWYPDRPKDQSLLLHELAHHRQVDAKHWYCEQAMEWDAYKLQEAFLADLGEQADFYWARIVLESSCAVRDHHPD